MIMLRRAQLQLYRASRDTGIYTGDDRKKLSFQKKNTSFVNSHQDGCVPCQPPNTPD